jgi:hypothetical protein
MDHEKCRGRLKELTAAKMRGGGCYSDPCGPEQARQGGDEE